MNRRDFMQFAGGAAAWAASAPSVSRQCSGGEAAAPADRTFRIVSRKPPLRWEDAMISGDGSTGIMVMGLPFDDLIVVNHAKFWVVSSDFKPRTPDLHEAWKTAREIAQQGRYRDADEFINKEAGRAFREMYGGPEVKGRRPWYDRTHPGFHLHVATESNGAPQDYRRETNLATGEITVSWKDDRGEWSRRVFVSRTDHVIVMELVAPAGSTLRAALRLSEAPGKLDGDLREVAIEHSGMEMYLHAAYGRTMGKAKPEGYHALARVVVEGGKARAVAGERIEVEAVRRVLLVMRVEYLDDAAAADRSALSRALSALPGKYEALLAPHAAAHGEMFRRVSLELGSESAAPLSSEDLVARAAEGKNLPEFYELLHAMGRYALICGGTGELPPSLMGTWGNQWAAPWDGRYTFDANLNLAISAASQGNLPEAIHTFSAFLERYRGDWRENAARLYGCRGVVTDLCQGWRHGCTLMATFPWTGGAGWLASYLYDHYLFTQDRRFLAEHVVPLLKDAATFYEDFVRGYPEHCGRVTFYPSISPENSPRMSPSDQSSGVVPNATGEIAICRQVLTILIAACRELGTDKDNLPHWESLLAKLPDNVINQDGALAEWAYPDLGDRYNHRHSSHLYGVYPALEISPDRTPELFRAARVALAKRLEFGMGEGAAHGYMHISLIAARLKDAGLMAHMLREFARLPFVNTSFTTCHYPGPRVYNLDTTFCMPAVLMEMLVYSEPGMLEILPALPQGQFPRGVLRGALARGGVRVEELRWDFSAASIEIGLRAATAQSIALRFGSPVRSLESANAADSKLISPDKKHGWRVALPAPRTVRLIAGMDKTKPLQRSGFDRHASRGYDDTITRRLHNDH